MKYVNRKKLDRLNTSYYAEMEMEIAYIECNPNPKAYAMSKYGEEWIDSVDKRFARELVRELVKRFGYAKRCWFTLLN